MDYDRAVGWLERIRTSWPEPSGEVVWHDINNSYGAKGVYKVGSTEIENPRADVEWALQYLADALSALDFEEAQVIDSLAEKARATLLATLLADIPLNGPLDQWDSVSDSTREAWRRVVRMLRDAG